MHLNKFSIIAASGSLLVGALMLIAGLVLGYKVFPDAVQTQVAEQILLKPGTESWKMWQKLPIPMEFKIYIFNVSNPLEVSQGVAPDVTELGPYVYKEYREKEDIVVHEEYGTASYKQRMHFEFDPEASAPYTDLDQVTIFNMALMGMIEVGVKLGLQPYLINQIPALFNDTKNMFLTMTVGDLLFGGVKMNCKGFAGIICNVIKGQDLPPTIRVDGKDLYFSIFGFKNNSDDGLYEVKLGWSPLGPYPTVDGAKTVGRITRWQNSSKVTSWQADECNQIKGTDAAIFPPFLSKETRIDIFSTDLCRSLYAVFGGEGNYHGIPSMKFVAEEYMLANVTVNPNNNCFCPKEKACLLSGALDLTDCQGAPIILTLPHFYLSSEKYLQMITGLNPVAQLHETFLELEPTTGVPLRGGKRIQFSMMLREVEGVDVTAGVPIALMPFIWIDEGLSLDEANVNRLKDELISTLNILDAVKYVLISLGGALMVIGCLILIISLTLKRKYGLE